ncbi:MAG: ankyrin repeat domain-containing protein [Sulfuricurvum sp.]|nr:ankyrin repeat domain-containing protein [Sulfuricurvum sp.]
MKTKLYTSLIASLLLISGCTTYHSAAAKGNVKAIDRLHAQGEDINQVDSSGVTALIQAVNLNQKEGAVALLNAGANVNICDDVFKNTALHYAVMQGNVFFVRLLVENGADVSLRNKDEKSSFDLVQNSRNEEIKRLVKTHGKAPEIVNKKEVKIIELLKSEPVVIVAPVVGAPVIEKKSTAISEIEASAVLKRLMSKHETLAVRTFLNEHPESITLISDPKQQLRYVGPSGWRIMDIAEGLTRGVLKEKEIIEHIETASLPYKYFTEDEIRIISHYGISIKIIKAMISVTH